MTTPASSRPVGTGGRAASDAVLVTGIGELVTCAGADGTIAVDAAASVAQRLGLLRDAAVVAVDGVVEWVGRAVDAPAADRRLDLGGRAVVPGFVDSHSHLVYAGDRAGEFSARMAGTPYDGGGIGVSVSATRAASDDALRALLRARSPRCRRAARACGPFMRRANHTTASAEPTPADIRNAVKNPDSSSQKR